MRAEGEASARRDWWGRSHDPRGPRGTGSQTTAPLSQHPGTDRGLALAHLSATTVPHCPCLTIYRTDGSSYPTTQAPPPPQGFGNLKTAKTFEWVHMKCCPASFCLKDSSCPPSPPTHHPPKRFLCQDEEEVPGSGGAPRHEGLLQWRRGTGWARHGRGPGSAARFPGISSHRRLLIQGERLHSFS